MHFSLFLSDAIEIALITLHAQCERCKVIGVVCCCFLNLSTTDMFRSLIGKVHFSEQDTL